MNYRVRITTLTPLHIGSGSVLLRDYDYVTGKDKTFVLNQDAVYADAYDRTGQVPTRPAGRLIAVTELKDNSPFVRYSLTGTTTVDQIQEQIKDPHSRCYLPGSSLKGALRTVLFAHSVRSKAISINLDALDYARERAAHAWEQAAFGRDPNHDLLRALQIADSAPLPTVPARTMLLQTRVFAGNRPSALIWVEAVAHQTSFQTTLRLDDGLLKQNARDLGWEANADWLTRLPELANTLARERIAAERAFAQKSGWPNPGIAFDRWAAMDLKTNQFLLQMGWGTGWAGMTIGSLLSASDQLKVRAKYRLGRPPRSKGDWTPDPNKPFPKSRRYHVARGNNLDAEPGVPLGWVLVSLQPEA